MKTLYIATIAALGILLLAGTASAQGITDLLKGNSQSWDSRSKPQNKVYVGKDRVDLKLGANVIPSVTGRDRGHGEIGLSANVDLDFVCGQFDLKGTFKNLLGREAREEFLQGIIGYVESEVTGSAMELLCQAQPTVCTLLQNHNIAANLKLGYHYDRCAEIENAIDNAQHRVYASAVAQCLQEKKSAGMSLAEALDACRRADKVRGFQGESLPSFDLSKELVKLVGLSDEGKNLLQGVSENVRYGGTWSASKPDADVVSRRHEEIRNLYVDRWGKALEAAKKNDRLQDDDIALLSPPKAPPVTREEVQGFSMLSPYEQAAAVSSVASAAALVQLTREIHEVERALEAVAGAPTIEEGQRKMLEERVSRLRKERARLEELYHDQESYQNAYLGARALAEREREARVGREREKVALIASKRDLYARSAPWGSGGRKPAAAAARGTVSTSSPTSGDSCGTCGLEYTVGTTGGSW